MPSVIPFPKLGVLALLLAITIGVWSYPILRQLHPSTALAHGSHEHADAHSWLADVPGRTTALCVAHHNRAQVTNEVMTKVQTAFERVRTHRYFVAAGLDRNSGPPIVAGCPTNSVLNTSQWGRLTVQAPGTVQTYVFIVTADELRGTQFKHYPRVVGHEQMCVDTACNSVANAVYITPEELNNRDVLVKALIAGLGLPLDDTAQQSRSDGLTPDDKSR